MQGTGEPNEKSIKEANESGSVRDSNTFECQKLLAFFFYFFLLKIRCDERRRINKREKVENKKDTNITGTQYTLCIHKRFLLCPRKWHISLSPFTHIYAIFYASIVCVCLCACSYIPLYHIIIITCHVLYISFAAIVISSISTVIIRVIIVREALLNCVCDVLFSSCVWVCVREPILRLSEWFFPRLFRAKWKRMKHEAMDSQAILLL